MWHIYILDIWRMSCCQCADRGNGTNLYILLCPCPNASHCTGTPSCPFRRSDPRSLQQYVVLIDWSACLAADQLLPCCTSIGYGPYTLQLLNKIITTAHCLLSQSVSLYSLSFLSSQLLLCTM